nr:MAG TPA: hypothetical protein [Caudoviricetes sp.]
MFEVSTKVGTFFDKFWFYIFYYYFIVYYFCGKVINNV